jgi:hypothetical protein
MRQPQLGAEMIVIRLASVACADAGGFARVVLSPSQRSVPFYRRAGFGPAGALLSREHPAG